MKKAGAIVFLMCMFACICAVSLSEMLDISVMTYDELEALQGKIVERMDELKRQYAIENGNRVIEMDSDKLFLFEKQKQTLINCVTCSDTS